MLKMLEKLRVRPRSPPGSSHFGSLPPGCRLRQVPGLHVLRRPSAPPSLPSSSSRTQARGCAVGSQSPSRRPPPSPRGARCCPRLKPETPSWSPPSLPPSLSFPFPAWCPPSCQYSPLPHSFPSADGSYFQNVDILIQWQIELIQP